MTIDVVVVGRSANVSHSMRRYQDLLLHTYAELGHQSRLLVPLAILSRWSANKLLTKWFGYVEEFLIFPFFLRYSTSKNAVVHIADHSSAILVLLLARRRKVIVTVHDLIAVLAARGFYESVHIGRLGRLYQDLVVRGLKNASQLIAVSHATQSVISEVCDRQSRVIYNQLPGDIDFDSTTPSELKTKKPYAILVSSSGWRKRRDRAIKAWAYLRDQANWTDLELKVVGERVTEDEIEGLPLDLRSQIHEYPNVGDTELVAHYRDASVLLQLSLDEGFCWPIIEAQRHHVPCVCSDIPVLRETSGGIAIFVAADSLADVDWRQVRSGIEVLARANGGRDNVRRFSAEIFFCNIEENLLLLSRTPRS